MNEQTQPATPIFALVLVVLASAASPIGDPVRATWDTFTPWAATSIGA
ncbi:hypothetical protein [Pseudonocardia hierapolitana]|nr:hypothetical protein [Pseudonocardia hierapolitana]